MNSQDNQDDDRALPPPLDRMVEAIHAESLPVDAINRVKQRAKQLAESPSVFRSQLTTQGPRKSVRTTFGWLTAAAALLVVAGTMLFDSHSAGQAFAQVISKVKEANSVQFKMTTRFGNGRQHGGPMYLAGNRMRYEILEGQLIQIVDFDAKSALCLDTKQKTFQTLEITGKMSETFFDPINQLRNAKSSDAKELGAEILNGRATRIFRLPSTKLLGITGDCEMLIWVDKETELPAQIVIHDTDPKAEVEFRIEGFVWNKPVDEKLFALTAPEGYQRGIVVIVPPNPQPVSPTPVGIDNLPAFANDVLQDRAPGKIVWSRDGSSIVALMRDPESTKFHSRRTNDLRAWDVASGKMQWTENVLGATSFAASTDGNFLANVIGREIQIRELSTGKIAKKWATTETVSPLAFSLDGKTLAAGITDWGTNGGKRDKASGGVQIWDLERDALINTFTDEQPTTFVAFAANGLSFATSSNSGPIKLRSVANGELMRVFPGYGQAAFTRDGESIACVSPSSGEQLKSGKIDIYRLTDGSLVKSLVSEPGKSTSTLLSLSISANGRYLAGADWNGTVTIWDIASGERKQTVSGHQSGVLSIAFAPDGTKFATGSEDKTLRIWKLAE